MKINGLEVQVREVEIFDGGRGMELNDQRVIPVDVGDFSFTFDGDGFWYFHPHTDESREIKSILNEVNREAMLGEVKELYKKLVPEILGYYFNIRVIELKEKQAKVRVRLWGVPKVSDGHCSEEWVEFLLDDKPGTQWVDSPIWVDDCPFSELLSCYFHSIWDPYDDDCVTEPVQTYAFKAGVQFAISEALEGRFETVTPKTVGGLRIQAVDFNGVNGL